MSEPVSATGPLAGIRVVDLTHHLGGPLATMALGQMGADVVKVEPPAGDEWRRVDDVDGESRQFHATNRDKRGVVLDLRTDGGRAALAALIDAADVLVHGFAPDVAERLGAGADEALDRNPRLIHCSLSAVGPGGLRGTDVPLQDIIAPWIMASGILAALYERERSGRGQAIETSRRRIAFGSAGSLVVA